jgi:hypothetical protein
MRVTFLRLHGPRSQGDAHGNFTLRLADACLDPCTGYSRLWGINGPPAMVCGELMDRHCNGGSML